MIIFYCFVNFPPPQIKNKGTNIFPKKKKNFNNLASIVYEGVPPPNTHKKRFNENKGVNIFPKKKQFNETKREKIFFQKKNNLMKPRQERENIFPKKKKT